MICPSCKANNDADASFCKECGYSLKDASHTLETPAVMPGQKKLQQGRYIIKGELGAGGMGQVFLAGDTKMDGDVVIKEMRQLATSGEQKEYMENRFIQEAKILFNLKHSNLPKVLDYFVEDDNLYLVMELIKGRNLDEIIKEKPAKLPVNHCVQWLRKILDILDYLHILKPPIIHRDVKPSNILLTPDDQLFLVDFGLARPVEAKTHTTVGTFGYASPEHYSGKCTQSSDIFSLGAAFHYLLTGDDPQDRQIFHYPPLSKYRDDVPKELEDILNKMLQFNKVNRYKDARAVLDDLDRYEKGEPLIIENIPRVEPGTEQPGETAPPKREDENEKTGGKPEEPPKDENKLQAPYVSVIEGHKTEDASSKPTGFISPLNVVIGLIMLILIIGSLISVFNRQKKPGNGEASLNKSPAPTAAISPGPVKTSPMVAVIHTTPSASPSMKKTPEKSPAPSPSPTPVSSPSPAPAKKPMLVVKTNSEARLKVFDSKGLPAGKGVYETKNRECTIKDLDKGQYKVTASADNYEPSTSEKFTLESGKTMNVSLEMKPRRVIPAPYTPPRSGGGYTRPYSGGGSSGGGSSGGGGLGTTE